MSKPVVAVVGRPNVGKSTLFNALAGSRISIVEDTPGVTRDRIYAEVSWLDYQFTLIDTGGIEPESDDIIISRMREQAETAIMTADVILFLVDVRQGLVDADFKVADMLRRSHRPVLLVVNKVDNFEKYMPDVYEFYNLGLGDPIPVSAQGKLGIGDMLDHVIEQFETPAREEEEEDERPKIAVIGKPNAGKSSIINKLLGEERVIVSPVAGTTRDAIDTTVKRNGQEYIFIDTAGLRRKSKIKEELERYSIIRTVTAVERCDVAVLIIDATEGITEQDAKIAGIAHERGKGMIIAVNKWDLVEKDNTTMKKFTEKIREKLSYMPYAELIFLSAKTGQRLPKLFDMIDAVIENCALRVQTGQEYIFIDTAGLRRKSKIKEELERYSIIRTVTAVERCDVAVLIIDATEGITEQDAKIAGIAHERGKGMIIAVNKWDLVEKDNTTMKKFTEKIREKLSYMPYAELIFLSAKTGQRLPKLFDMIDAVIENCALRVQTGVLNEILTEAMAMKQPPSDKGKRLRIYYITQVSVKPPTFVMFINEKKLTHFSYTRYIENQIRTTFGFRGTPIHFIYRERKEK